MSEQTPQQEYESWLSEIRDGFTIYEDNARQLIEMFGLPVEPLEEALRIGARKEYDRVLSYLRNGEMLHTPESIAKRLAEERAFAERHGLPISELEAAVKEGIAKAAERLKTLGRAEAAKRLEELAQ